MSPIDLSGLTATVTDVVTVEGSAVALLTGVTARMDALAAQIKTQQMDADAASVAVQAESDRLKAATQPLSEAVAANTPAEPTP